MFAVWATLASRENRTLVERERRRRLAVLSILSGSVAGGGGILAIIATAGPFWIAAISKARQRSSLFAWAKGRLSYDPTDPAGVAVILHLAGAVSGKAKDSGAKETGKLVKKALAAVD